MKVDIENFQSLSKASLNIEKFTALIGRNNLGKSAATRAIGSVVKNRGDFTRKGSKSSKVTLEIDSLKVSRIKGSSVNYEVNGKIYSSIGREVPQEIIDLGFKPILLGKDRVYIQFPNQFEKVFLLDQPDSVIAETISKISKIDVVNNALRLVNLDRKRNESTLKIREQDFIKLKSRLKHYEKVDDLNLKAEQILNLKQEITHLEESLQEIAGFIEDLIILSQMIKSLSEAVRVELPEIAQILLDFNSFQELIILDLSLQDELEQVKNLTKVEDIEIPILSEKISESFNLVELFLNTYERLESAVGILGRVLKVQIPEVELIRESFLEFENLKTFEENQESLSKSIVLIEKEISQNNLELENLEQEILSIRKSSTCPFKEVFGCKENW